eukprot:2496185-Alexandrium_andersonii.AAC.1
MCIRDRSRREVPEPRWVSTGPSELSALGNCHHRSGLVVHVRHKHSALLTAEHAAGSSCAPARRNA